MKAKLKYFSDDFIDNVWGQKEKFFDMMKSNPEDCSWLNSFYGKNPFIESDYEFDFEFIMNDEDKNGSDYQNAINLYELFKKHDVGRATIYNEKFLTGFLFTFGYKYFFWEVGLNNVSKLFGPLFFGNKGPRRSMATNVIARLYRSVEMTIDESLEDKYELTKLIYNNRIIMLDMSYYPYLDGPVIHKSLLRAIQKWQIDTGIKVTDSMFRIFRKKITIYASVNKIDLMDANDVINKFYQFIDKAYYEVKNGK